MLEFKAFPKIPRWNRPLLVTEKIDGTNGVIQVDPDGTVRAGSRKRWVTVDQDNFGFAAFVQENADELRRLGTGFHYGEWWGKGIQRHYGVQDRRFSLFDTERWSDPSIRPLCCRVVPVLATLAQVRSEDLDGIIRDLLENGSKAETGFLNPEGIIIRHTVSGMCFKMTCRDDLAKESRLALPERTTC